MQNFVLLFKKGEFLLISKEELTKSDKEVPQIEINELLNKYQLQLAPKPYATKFITVTCTRCMNKRNFEIDDIQLGTNIEVNCSNCGQTETFLAK